MKAFFKIFISSFWSQDDKIISEVLFRIILKIAALIAWIFLFIHDWRIGLLLFFILWDNNYEYNH